MGILQLSCKILGKIPIAQDVTAGKDPTIAQSKHKLFSYYIVSFIHLWLVVWGFVPVFGYRRSLVQIPASPILIIGVR